MSYATYPDRSTEPGSVTVPVRLLGAGATVPTKVYGAGVSVTRTAVGVYVLTFDSLPGQTFAGMTHGLDAATPAALAGCTVVMTTPVAGALVYTITLYSGSTTPAARELAPSEYINLDLTFKKTSV